MNASNYYIVFKFSLCKSVVEITNEKMEHSTCIIEVKLEYGIKKLSE